MRQKRREPSHPGQILKRQYMDPIALTITELANALGVSRKTLSKIINQHAGISPEMALRLSQAFDSSPELWLNLQQNYDLWHAAKETSTWQNVEKIAA